MTYSYVTNYAITMLIHCYQNNLYLWIPFPMECLLIVKLTFWIFNHLAFTLPSEYCVDRIGIVGCCGSAGAQRQPGLVWARVQMRRVENRSGGRLDGKWEGPFEPWGLLFGWNILISRYQATQVQTWEQRQILLKHGDFLTSYDFRFPVNCYLYSNW